MSISVSLYVEGSVLYVNLNGELDHHTADQLRNRLNSVMTESNINHIVFNLKHLDFMDSSGIGVIMGRYRMICLIGGEVWAVHANARIRKILTMSGVTKIMQIYEEEQV